MVTGVGRDRRHARARCSSYDYTVLAGTQGLRQPPQDRPAARAGRAARPAGGAVRRGRRRAAGRHRLGRRLRARRADVHDVGPAGRPGADRRRRLRAYCFAGNAALVGVCDVVIATEGSSIGMGGPAMIEGGGLGVVEPEDVGPIDVQARQRRRRPAWWPTTTRPSAAARAVPRPTSPGAGCRREARRPAAAAPRSCRRTACAATTCGRCWRLSPTPAACWSCAPASAPGSSPRWPGSTAAPVGVLANDPRHLGGAIDADGADKAAALPAAVRGARAAGRLPRATPRASWSGPSRRADRRPSGASARLFVAGAQPHRAAAAPSSLRKAYGLGAHGDGRRRPAGAAAHRGLADRRVRPDGPGGRGAARLPAGAGGARRTTPRGRRASTSWSPTSYERGKALNVASVFEIDDVIDPADTRKILTSALTAAERTG